MTTIAENLKIIKDSTADIKQAIIEKGGEVGNLTTYADAIRGIQTGTSSSIWTGHVDVEGLKAIGWDDDDIAYFQEHGVNWMAEDDEYYKVSDDNKALYGVLNWSNLSQYKDRIVYLPKIDTAGKTDFSSKFKDFSNLIALPKLNTSSNTNLNNTFANCYNLTFVPPLDMSKVTSIGSCFSACHAIKHIPDTFIPNEVSSYYCFREAYSLDNLNIKMSTTNCGYMFYLSLFKCLIGELDVSQSSKFNNFLCQARRITYVEPILDLGKATDVASFATNTECLREIKIKNLPLSISFNISQLLSKESVLFMINNEAATSPITITLHANAYARLANDPDIVAALSNHPNVSLASA